jgi:hypothetical protein
MQSNSLTASDCAVFRHTGLIRLIPLPGIKAKKAKSLVNRLGEKSEAAEKRPVNMITCFKKRYKDIGV